MTNDTYYVKYPARQRVIQKQHSSEIPNSWVAFFINFLLIVLIIFFLYGILWSVICWAYHGLRLSILDIIIDITWCILCERWIINRQKPSVQKFAGSIKLNSSPCFLKLTLNCFSNTSTGYFFSWKKWMECNSE